ncbi:MAG: TetR/AcrR family transcriptional regulator [Pseudomonadota bacterium]
MIEDTQNTAAAQGGITRRDRANETRLKIVGAATRCIEHYGYSGTSVSRITELAGVSRGAYLHHFRAKHLVFRAVALQLVADVVDHLNQIQMEEIRTKQDLRDVLYVLWEDVVLGPVGRVFTELMLAARTDSILATHMRRPARRAIRVLGWVAARKMPRNPKTDLAAKDIVRLAQWVLRGMSLDQPLSTDPNFFHRQIDLLVEMVVPHLPAEDGI